MARPIDRQIAINLRKQGRTYGEIKRELGISKSTLSDWLRTYPLNSKQLALIKKSRFATREIAIEKTRITKQKNDCKA